jgi:polyphosphate kinase 2 (PPK2 family)
VEYVMGFCTKNESQAFVANCPVFESHITKAGILLVKFWLEVGQEEQRRRFEARIKAPVRQWKLSPMDLEATDTEEAPWYIVRSDDKKRPDSTALPTFSASSPTRKWPATGSNFPSGPTRASTTTRRRWRDGASCGTSIEEGNETRQEQS